MTAPRPIPEKEMHLLLKALLSLENEEECAAFLNDAFTVNEIRDIEHRLKVASLLSENKSYQEISNETGASTATISRVSRYLNYGSSGYRIVLDRMERKKQSE